MIKFTIRRVTIEEIEVLAERDQAALLHAVTAQEGHEKYSFECLGVRVLEQHMEIAKREAPPVCGINDDGVNCQEPVSRMHYKLEQRFCATHSKTLSEATS